MNTQNQTQLKFASNQLVDLWRNFCEKHTELYEYTCDEYMHLIASDIDKLNTTLADKKVLLNEINQLDLERKEVTTEVSALLNINTEPAKLTFLLSHLKSSEESLAADHIEKLNLILLDIIDKIQEQNKKNQVFLNKAILSLRELKESFSGKTQYKTYSSSGMTRR